MRAILTGINFVDIVSIDFTVISLAITRRLVKSESPCRVQLTIITDTILKDWHVALILVRT